VALLCAACTPVNQIEDLATYPILDGGRCIPGRTQFCNCLGGGQGVQVCRATGASYGTCAGCGEELPDGLTLVGDGGTPCGDCDGCCSGTLCVPYANQSDGQCGVRGQSCASCGGKTCSTMNGTCNDNTNCVNCRPGVICDAGSCTSSIDPTASFKVWVKSATVLVNNTNCQDTWDFVGEPDPYVCVAYQSGGTLFQGCNQGNYANNSLSASWDMNTGLMTSGGTAFLVPGDVFTSGKLQISLYDYDSCFNGCVDDLMAQGFYPGKTTFESEYSTGPFGCAMDVTFVLE
jgi:hypothetical protein